MKVIMVMFDSLNRHMLSPYGCDWTHTPNFQRLAKRTATFDRSYVCSMPCMPARRDLHTGRPNFLHRSWGPLEPFDDSMPRMLREAGVHTQLISDHYHYWEAGGSTYHPQYTAWEFFRGREGDPWKGMANPPGPVNAYGRNAGDGPMLTQDRINRSFIKDESDWPQSMTFKAGIEHIRRNADAENWFLQLETFDPHEPFTAHRQYKDHFAEHYASWREKNGPLWDWPDYAPVKESPDMVEHMRYEYASLLAMCDAKLGNILDLMDELSLWDDTMLIVWTDHGFLLGEHDAWAKMWMGFYNEVAHTPFFLWDPRHPEAAGQRRQALVQPSIDLPVTLLKAFGQEPTKDMLGCDLAPAVADDTPLREAAMFGQFGNAVNVTDGRYVYMRGPIGKPNEPLANYTLMPTNMRQLFGVDQFQKGNVTLAEPFSFTKGCQTMRLSSTGAPGVGWRKSLDTRLFDLQDDPGQINPIEDEQVEAMMTEHLVRCMKACDAPAEQYERLGVAKP